jgi:hypothetical protein
MTSSLSLPHFLTSLLLTSFTPEPSANFTLQMTGLAVEVQPRHAPENLELEISSLSELLLKEIFDK